MPLSLRTGSRTTNAASLQMKTKNQISSGILLHSSFTPSSLSFASASSSGNSLGLDLKSSIGRVANRWRSLVVRAVKYVLCQTKRNRSRKSLARTHGFRKRMSTTKGRATIKKRDDGICAQKQIPTVENELEAEGFILEEDCFLIQSDGQSIQCSCSFV